MVSIVIPTRNEEGNIRRLLVALKEIAMLYDCHFEYIIVDDSDDDTGLIAYSLGARVIKGQGKGLGQAMLDGLHMSYGDIVVFMDADLSHDPQYIPSLLKPILDYGYDMTIGSRYVADGGSAGWGKTRSLMSRIAGMIGYPITGIRDSSSGFFAIKRGIAISAFPSYEPSSWKIMLEILVKANPIAVCEIPIIFKERNAGKSKYNTKEGIKYLAHLGKLLMYKLSHSHIKQDCNEADYEWRSYFKANPLRRKWKSKIYEFASYMSEGNKILDFGCGSSPMVNLVRHSNYLGIDSNIEKIKYMNGKNIKNAYYDCGDMNSLERLESDYDSVMCLEVIEHMESVMDGAVLIRSLRDRLKPSGILIMATPNYSNLIWNIIEKAQKFIQPTYHTMEHKARFTELLLDDICGKLGMIKVESQHLVFGADMVLAYRRVQS